MSWQKCKIKWQLTWEGQRIKELSGMEIFEIPELKDICERFRRGYYDDREFRAILIQEIQALEMVRL